MSLIGRLIRFALRLFLHLCHHFCAQLLADLRLDLLGGRLMDEPEAVGIPEGPDAVPDAEGALARTPVSHIDVPRGTVAVEDAHAP